MSLADWAESVFRTVEQDGAFATRVQLITPATGDIWHTWNHPLPAPSNATVYVGLSASTATAASASATGP